MKKIAVVVVGLPGSGKTEAANIMKRDGFKVIEFGDVVRAKMKYLKIPIDTHESTRTFSTEQRVRYGNDIMARYLLKSLKQSKGRKDRIAIMGMRSTYELNYLRKHIKNILIIALSAPIKLRFQRMRARARPGEPKTLKQFMWVESQEKHNYKVKGSNPIRHGMLGVIRQADFVISNDKGLKELAQNFALVIDEIKRE